MATAVKKHKNGIKHPARKHTTKMNLPRGVTQQLERIYAQSRKQATKHPYKVAGGILLSLGLASGAYFLVRYLRNQ